VVTTAFHISVIITGWKKVTNLTKQN